MQAIIDLKVNNFRTSKNPAGKTVVKFSRNNVDFSFIKAGNSTHDFDGFVNINLIKNGVSTF